MTRLKVHHVCEGGVPRAVTAERAHIGLRTVERILTEPTPTPERGQHIRLAGPSWRTRDVDPSVLDGDPGMTERPHEHDLGLE